MEYTTRCTDPMITLVLRFLLVCAMMSIAQNSPFVLEWKPDGKHDVSFLIDEDELCHLVYHGLAMRLHCSSKPGLFIVMTLTDAHNTLHHLSSCNRQYMKILARCNSTLSWYYRIVLLTYESGIRHLLGDATLSGLSSSEKPSSNVLNERTSTLPLDNMTFLNKRSNNVYSGSCVIESIQKSLEEYLIHDHDEIKYEFLCSSMLRELTDFMKTLQCAIADFDAFNSSLQEAVDCSLPSGTVMVPEAVCSEANMNVPCHLLWLMLLSGRYMLP